MNPILLAIVVKTLTFFYLLDALVTPAVPTAKPRYTKVLQSRSQACNRACTYVLVGILIGADLYALCGSALADVVIKDSDVKAHSRAWYCRGTCCPTLQVHHVGRQAGAGRASTPTSSVSSSDPSEEDWSSSASKDRCVLGC